VSYIENKIIKMLWKILMVSFSGLLSAGAMGFWHGVEYYEKERVVGEEFYQQWNSVSNLDNCIT